MYGKHWRSLEDGISANPNFFRSQPIVVAFIIKMKEIQKVYLKNSRMSSSENNIAVLASAKWEYA